MSDCRLYLISPPLLPEDFAESLARALDGGPVAAFQLRLKDQSDDVVRQAVTTLMPRVQAQETAFILNDRPDLAAELGCDGVHIGQKDTPYAEARARMGDQATVGVTCHDSRHLAMTAAEAGADYVAFGAFYPTTTKDYGFRPQPELLHWWSTLMEIPVVAIGGITPDNGRILVEHGADFLAVVSAVWQHEDGPGVAVAAFTEMMAETDRLPLALTEK